ncbi:TIGR03088 family PEP-CTERM/XrtA system glycosyltransferase [Massilia rubra]|uniref:TIGR03088 family PEP-CTERM/XrtA system glycosyltransferase n=1 Tax=Massilia rubra TaxID=2607910 RepID=A0ABX0LXI6_9BURK|nr:TIGR03088 family PEP-CTERM/XrtA system glycosyltransferase [Massilia rubra]NHZ34776.1 TIGR03088 family PEP-CTERM/XrtA system glycosyltransferase [Massilia rubra]
MTAQANNTPPLVVHLIYRLDFGGLETLLVERINRMPAAHYRHAVVCLTDYTAFADKITKPGVQLFALHKQPGLSLGTHAALFTLLRRLRPTILHTYNLSAVEYAPAALLAGVPVRINGLHGRDAGDPQGRNRKHNLLRRLMLPFYDCCYANSADMLAWNRTVIGVAGNKSRLLSNGIDADKFTPQGSVARHFGPETIVIGTVGRIQDVKDHATLLRAFVLLHARLPQVRLAIVGGGPLLAALQAQAEQAGVAHLVWLPGARLDVADILRGFDVFALSSIAEGTPGSALEAMASSLPVVGTRVGGVPEVVADGVTGILVPPSDAPAMAAALERYAFDAAMRLQHGAAGRARVERHYNMAAMVAAYESLYDALCEHKKQFRKSAKSCVE